MIDDTIVAVAFELTPGRKLPSRNLKAADGITLTFSYSDELAQQLGLPQGKLSADDGDPIGLVEGPNGTSRWIRPEHGLRLKIAATDTLCRAFGFTPGDVRQDPDGLGVIPLEGT